MSVGATTGQKLRDVLWLSAACAMATTAYFLVRAVGYLTVGGGFATVSRDVAWMAPLSHAFYFGVVTLPALALAPFLSRPRLLRVAAVLCFTTTLFIILLPWTQLSAVTRLLLSLGVAVELTRRVTGDLGRSVRVARGVALSLAAACIVAAIGVAGWRTVARQRALAALPSPPAGAPNVLLIILDTVRASALSLYGYERETTPQLDAFSQGGTVFEMAVAPAPWTLPSHATLFTGRYPAWLRIDFRTSLEAGPPTLAEILARRGYYTVGMVANTGFVSWESGLARGFLEYHDYPVNAEQVLRSSLPGSATIAERFFGRKSHVAGRQKVSEQIQVPPKPTHYLMDAEDLTDRFLSWHASRDAKRPYFAFLNYFDAHFPYEPPDSLRRAFSASPKPRDLYDAEIRYMDGELGRLFGALRDKGELSNTIVIVTSDHGEHFGERGLRLHGNSLYSAVVRVPLSIRYDGHVPAGRRIDTAVSLRDVGRTILDLAGLRAAPFPGSSLANAWGATPDSLSVPVALLHRVIERDPLAPRNPSAMAAVFDARWHLIQMAGSRQVEEVFDYRADSAELVNLVGSPEAREALPSLRARLRDALLADRERQRPTRRVSQ
jgi:arylsulfatase A-like enzyme